MQYLNRTDRERSILGILMRTATRLQTLFDKTIPQLTLKQFMLLEILRQSPEPLTLNEIGERLGCSRQNVRQLTESLTQKGLVVVEPSDRVSRALCVRLTDKNHDSFAEQLESHIRDLDYLFEGYSDTELGLLLFLMKRLDAGTDNLEKKAPELLAVSNPPEPES